LTETIGTNDFDDIPNAHEDDAQIIECPVLPTFRTVIFPNVIMPLTMDTATAISVFKAAQDAGTTVITLNTDEAFEAAPAVDDLYLIGTEVAPGRLIVARQDRHTALVEGRRRVRILEFIERPPYLVARAEVLEDIITEVGEIPALHQTLIDLIEELIDSNDALADEILNYTDNVDDASWLTDFLASMLPTSFEERQQLLELDNLNERMRSVAQFINRELTMLEIRDEIEDQVRQEITEVQHEMFLREQMRVIQNELGETDVYQQELDVLQQQIVEAGMPAEAHEKALQELRRLQMLPTIAPEVGMIRTYLDWLVTLPWSNSNQDNLDLNRAQAILDAEHHGLPKIKDRILEHIAVRKLAEDKMKTPILCFVGPPGVGKTSLGQSIASALGREFVRVSLGGVRDEAEIRGHRRTYIGALPGRILQTMRRIETVNPVFMLDEIDKLGADFRGDPAAALLEVLDPEQNRDYVDHYLDVNYDLSKVMFITTANDLYPLPEALLDRMEVVEFPGYTEEDKLEIARQFLIPKQLEGHGIADQSIRFTTDALLTIIREYTYEAGVRNLNREIGAVCRKLARLTAEGKKHPKRVNADHVQRYLGPPQYIAMRVNDVDSIGVATGLAWTSGGGDVLTIEVSILPGKGSLMLTGQLGEIMQESAQTALSYLRSRAKDLDLPHDDFDNYDAHIHLPEGAVPKDGPSAGITLATALISAFTERKVRSDWAMTGEITLRGKVLPVGGIKEKVLAARRSKVKNILLPEQNRKDLSEIPPKALRDMNICFVEDMQQVMDTILLEVPTEGRQRDHERAEEQIGADDD
jgi:ATP-dependent Lon protease